MEKHHNDKGMQTMKSEMLTTQGSLTW